MFGSIFRGVSKRINLTLGTWLKWVYRIIVVLKRTHSKINESITSVVRTYTKDGSKGSGLIWDGEGDWVGITVLTLEQIYIHI